MEGVDGQHLELHKMDVLALFFLGCGYCSYKSDYHFGTEEPRRV